MSAHVPQTPQKEENDIMSFIKRAMHGGHRLENSFVQAPQRCHVKSTCGDFAALQTVNSALRQGLSTGFTHILRRHRAIWPRKQRIEGSPRVRARL